MPDIYEHVFNHSKKKLKKKPIDPKFGSYQTAKSYKKLKAKRYPRDFEILGWCPAAPVLPHGEKVPL